MNESGPFHLWVHEQDGTLVELVSMSRGYSVAEALAEVDRYLDRGYRVISDIPQVVTA